MPPVHQEYEYWPGSSPHHSCQPFRLLPSPPRLPALLLLRLPQIPLLNYLVPRNLWRIRVLSYQLHFASPQTMKPVDLLCPSLSTRIPAYLFPTLPVGQLTRSFLNPSKEAAPVPHFSEVQY